MLYLLPELRYTAYFLREAKDYVMKNYDPATPYEGGVHLGVPLDALVGVVPVYE